MGRLGLLYYLISELHYSHYYSLCDASRTTIDGEISRGGELSREYEAAAHMCECEHESEHEQVNGNRRAASTRSRDVKCSAIRVYWENFTGGSVGFGALWHRGAGRC